MFNKRLKWKESDTWLLIIGIFAVIAAKESGLMLWLASL